MEIEKELKENLLKIIKNIYIEISKFENFPPENILNFYEKFIISRDGYSSKIYQNFEINKKTLNNKENILNYCIENGILIEITNISHGKDEENGYSHNLNDEDLNLINKKMLLLDSILVEISPNISYLNYKFLTEHSKNISFLGEKKYEYYGYYDINSACIIKINEVLNFLNEKNILISNDECLNILKRQENENAHKSKKNKI